jgi:hypothetical protein
MSDSTNRDPKAVALSFMKRASRDTFEVCAKSADDMATELEGKAEWMTAPQALRLLAVLFRGSARKE